MLCREPLGHSKLHFCFWSWIFQTTMRAGATSASQPPIQVNERWSSIIKRFAHHFAHVLYKLLRMLKIWNCQKACGRGTRNRSTTWRGLIVCFLTIFAVLNYGTRKEQFQLCLALNIEPKKLPSALSGWILYRSV